MSPGALQEQHKHLSRGSLQAVPSPRKDAREKGESRSGLSPAPSVAFRKSCPPLGLCFSREKHKLYSEEKNSLTFNSSKSLESLILKQNTPVMMSLGQRHITDQKLQQELFRDSSFLAVQLPHSHLCDVLSQTYPPRQTPFLILQILISGSSKPSLQKNNLNLPVSVVFWKRPPKPSLCLFQTCFSHDKNELKPLVMDGLDLLKIWHFNFKGMLERKRECLQHPGSYQDSCTAPYHLPGRKGSEMAPEASEGCLTATTFHNNPAEDLSQSGTVSAILPTVIPLL